MICPFNFDPEVFTSAHYQCNLSFNIQVFIIIIGTKSYVIAMGVVIGISIIMLGLSMFRSRASENYLLVLHYDPSAEQEIDAELHRGVRAYRVRSKTITRSGAEMTVDMRLSQRTDIVSHMLDISGVHDATLVSCQNESAV